VLLIMRLKARQIALVVSGPAGFSCICLIEI
jgi:hypothetical protein